jgi:hypothetical protein
MEQEKELLDSTQPEATEEGAGDEVLDIDTTEPVETTTEETPEERVEKLEAYNKQLHARNKALKEKLDNKPEAPQPTEKQESQPLTREEQLLFAQNVISSEEELNDAYLIAERNGVSLQDATKSNEFKALKEVREREIELKKAQLPPSRSSKVQEKKTFETPNLSREDHMKMVKEANRR